MSVEQMRNCGLFIGSNVLSLTALCPRLLRLSLVKRIKLSDTLFEEPPTSASTGEHLPIAR